MPVTAETTLGEIRQKVQDREDSTSKSVVSNWWRWHNPGDFKRIRIYQWEGGFLRGAGKSVQNMSFAT